MMSQNVSEETTGPATIAEVAFPIALPGVFDYRIPQNLQGRIAPGIPVLVDLKNRRIWGVAIVLKRVSAFSNLKEIIDARPDHWTDASASLIRLYRWMADYYQCDLGRVFRPRLSRRVVETAAKQQTVFIPDVKATGPLTPAQARAWQAFAGCAGPLTKKEIALGLGVTVSMVDALKKKGYLVQERREVVREAREMAAEALPEPVVLTDEQTQAVAAMCAKLDLPDKPFLLHGITGSGKTHVYTELSARALQRGRSVIVLVPEISLTPQTIMRFRAAVGDVVTVIHSNMSDGERRDSLQELVTGNKRLVIGVRSAILAPMNDVGLIIVDEEHDGSYKQTDTDPRYHARDVAIMRGHFQKALVVLGSATPSLESFQNARNGKYHLLRLTARFGPARLPTVRIVDMREEHKTNNWTVLSGHLEARMRDCLAAGRQIILLLNRRGYSSTLICKECGFTHRCDHCAAPLHFHLADHRLKCHLCGLDTAAPDRCPVCHGEQMKYKGTAIQKAEELVKEKFPEARILRMDRDTTRGKGSHFDILDAFAERQADILLGTQMVSKGLNFPGVALVGVLQADIGLLIPDFRAAERTFQLLTQVAGRAGRSDSLGDVVIQTYYPDDPAIKAAGQHDYEGFCEEELPHRQSLQYPPYQKLARIVAAGENEQAVRAEAKAVAESLLRSTKDCTLLGPAPAVLSKVNNEHRYSMLIKSPSARQLSLALAALRLREKKAAKNVKIIIDVDPVYML
jgi:primosomal protein N' (replication factor Y) (superfamily II helicase)